MTVMTSVHRQQVPSGTGPRRRFDHTYPTPLPPSGQILTSIAQGELDADANVLIKEDAKITNSKYAASYSWVSGSTGPTIIVPGKPPAWSPLQTARKLEGDKGPYFRDNNAARYPTYPTEPAVQALLMQQPQFSLDDVDVFGCGSTLGNLLRFARKFKHSFKFEVDVVGKTVFFVRRENSPTEVLHDVKGYGHSFPEAYTTWDADVKNSESHQRLVQYSFGGLNMIVRSESDGYFKDKVAAKSIEMEGNLIDLSTDDILEPLADIALADIATLGISPKPVTPGPKSSLNIRQAGQLVPQSSIFDIKTRYRHNTLPMSDTYPVLWLRQIPNFVLAYNDGGNFYDIRKHSLANVLSAWEQDHAQELKRFVVLIRRIVKLAREQDCAKLEIYRPTSSGDFDGIQIWKQAGDGVDVLPQHLRDRWTRRESGSVALPEEALISLETDDGKNGQSSGSKANTSKFEDGFAADDEDAGLKADFTA